MADEVGQVLLLHDDVLAGLVGPGVGNLIHVGQGGEHGVGHSAELDAAALDAQLAAAQLVVHAGAERSQTDAGAKGPGVVRVAHGAHALAHQRDLLTPQSVHQAVGDEAVLLLVQHAGCLVVHLVELAGLLNDLLGGLLAAADLDQGQQVGGVEGMAHDDTLGMLRLGRDLGHRGAGGGGGDDAVGGHVLLHDRHHLMLLLQVLRAVLLHEVHAGKGLGGVGRDLDLVPDLLAVIHDAQLHIGVDGALDVGDGALLGGLGTHIHVHVQPLQGEVGGKAAADGAGAIHADRLDVFHVHGETLLSKNCPVGRVRPHKGYRGISAPIHRSKGSGFIIKSQKWFVKYPEMMTERASQSIWI